MGIGSHTRTHRVLDTLDPSALRDELVGSRLDIERAIRARVSAISYPVGRPIRGLPLLERAVRAAGYDVGFVVEDRANPLVRLARDPFNVARRSLDGATSRHGLAALLAAPELSGAG
jgi:hypothetical protein